MLTDFIWDADAIEFQEGLMETHDEETKKFFKRSGVCCVLAPRFGATKMSWMRRNVCKFQSLQIHHTWITEGALDYGPAVVCTKKWI